MLSFFILIKTSGNSANLDKTCPFLICHSRPLSLKVRKETSCARSVFSERLTFTIWERQSNPHCFQVTTKLPLTAFSVRYTGWFQLFLSAKDSWINMPNKIYADLHRNWNRAHNELKCTFLLPKIGEFPNCIIRDVTYKQSCISECSNSNNNRAWRRQLQALRSRVTQHPRLKVDTLQNVSFRGPVKGQHYPNTIIL